MDQKKNHFLEGVVIGAAIGGAAVFFLGTKKGREVFKFLKNEGMERFGKIEDMVHEYQDVLREGVEDDMDDVKEKISAKTDKSKSLLKRKLFKGLSKRK